jgi:hypothetical protein
MGRLRFVGCARSASTSIASLIRYTADATRQNATNAMPASTTTSIRNTGFAAYAANGAASTRTFFTHWRGRAVRITPRTSPPRGAPAADTEVSLSAVLLI